MLMCSGFSIFFVIECPVLRTVFYNTTSSFYDVITQISVASLAHACAMFYGATGNSVYDDYMELWERTNTEIIEQSGGITYGSTDSTVVGAGFVDFCKSRGISLSEKTVENPAYNFFTACVNSGQMSLIHAGLSQSDGSYIGHTMTVEGYAQIRANSSGNVINTLMIYDGWNSYVRYLNVSFSDWYFLYGTAFYG